MPDYRLSWGNPTDRLLDITIRFTAPADQPRLLLPAWRPGRYLLQNYAANVRQWDAGARRIWKDGKTTWRVDAKAGEDVTVRYRFYAGQLDAGSSFLDVDEAYVNGSNLFMMVDGLREEEHRLVLAAPEAWIVETQLHRSDDGSFLARSYDDLIDSPIVAAASMTRHVFEESGAAIHLVFRGDEGIDTRQFVEPTRAIARTQARMFGGLPFDDYRFLYHVRDRWHGVEHEESCSIIAKRVDLLGAGPGDEGYDHFLSITSHELFHAWNVKRIVPARFSPYDYWVETPTRLLWVMEGITSYYGELTLLRGGVWTESRYLAHLQKEIETLESLPARKHLALSAASFDGWLSDPSQNHDHANAWFSFYTKGEVVAALLDLTIRRATNGGRSLDDVMRLLWREYGEPRRGLEEDGFERAVAQVADVGDFFARYVDGLDALPYEELFGAFGIGFAVATRDADEASLGVRLRPASGAVVVDAAIRGGAGFEAGLLPGDEIISIGGLRTSSEVMLEAALRGLAIGTTAEMIIARAGRIERLTLAGRDDPRPAVTLHVEEPSELRSGWLRRME